MSVKTIHFGCMKRVLQGSNDFIEVLVAFEDRSPHLIDFKAVPVGWEGRSES